MIDLSILIPVYKSEKIIKEHVEELLKAIPSVEIVLVVDGSPDGSAEICHTLSQTNINVKTIELSNNFGEHNAVFCGLAYCTKPYICIIDDDGQHGFAAIKKLYETIKTDSLDVVYGNYLNKKHSPFRNSGSWMINKLAICLFDKPKNLYLSSFKILTSELSSKILETHVKDIYLDAIILKHTRHIGQIDVEHTNSKRSSSSYTFTKLLKLATTVIFGYSDKPAKWIGKIGLVITTFGLFQYVKIAIHGQASLLTGMLGLFTGLILLSLGIIGQYLARTYAIAANFPAYSIKAKTNA